MHIERILTGLFVLLVSVTAFAQDFRTVHDGIEYAELTRPVSGKPVRMNLLRLDLRKVRLDVHHAMDAAIGTETTSSIAMRHRGVAAINAGFFRLDKTAFAGDAAGLLVIDGKLLSESIPGRVALWIVNGRDQTFVDLMKSNVVGGVVIGSYSRYLSGVNRERKADELVLLTPEFGSTTLTGDDGIELIVENRRVTRIENGKGNNPIPRGGYVLSANGKYRSELLSIKSGERFLGVGVRMYSWSEKHREMRISSTRDIEDIVGGVPQLLRDGRVDIGWEQEKTSRSFVETRHPRTAVAKLKDGKFLMITVDGRSELSGGIGLYDLAALLLEFGALDAMNLDGGGSTTMFLNDKVVNSPSDKEGERKVSDAIVVSLRKSVRSRNPRNK